MNAFDYAAPTSVDSALKALAGADSAEALSGGTDLLNRLKDGVAHPARVVYLKGIKDLGGVSGDGLSIGAGTRLADLVADKKLAEAFPALRQAALEVGTPQIRNMATVGGNLLQRPRCWYYRNGFGLLGMKDGKSLVRSGDNRHHAIFLTDGDALFAAPSSLAPPLIALGAKATLVGPKGERTVKVEELYRVPSREDQDQRELRVGKHEILTKITIPAAKGKNASYEVRHKQAHDWPIALASVCLEMDGDKVASARIVLGGVAPIPYRCEAAERAIRGQGLTMEAAEAAAKAGVADAKPLSMNAYKVPITRTAIKRALLAAAGNRYWEA